MKTEIQPDSRTMKNSDLSESHPFCRYKGRNALFVRRQGKAIQVQIPKQAAHWTTEDSPDLKICTGKRHSKP